MLKVYEWLVYIFMRPHKKFQHFIKWFDICFIRTKTNINKKRKERLNRNRKNLTCRPGGAGPASPPGPPGAGGSSSTSRAPKLLGGMPPSQPGGRHAPSLPGALPAPHLHACRRPGASPFHPPPPRTLPSSPSPVSSTPVKNAGARRRTCVDSEPVERHRRVHPLPHRRLPLPVQRIGPGALLAAGIELEPSPDPKDALVDFVAVKPPQPSPPPPSSSW